MELNEILNKLIKKEPINIEESEIHNTIEYIVKALKKEIEQNNSY